jgi:hypothetical protein
MTRPALLGAMHRLTCTASTKSPFLLRTETVMRGSTNSVASCSKPEKQLAS